MAMPRLAGLEGFEKAGDGLPTRQPQLASNRTLDGSTALTPRSDSATASVSEQPSIASNPGSPSTARSRTRPAARSSTAQRIVVAFCGLSPYIRSTAVPDTSSLKYCKRTAGSSQHVSPLFLVALGDSERQPSCHSQRRAPTRSLLPGGVAGRSTPALRQGRAGRSGQDSGPCSSSPGIQQRGSRSATIPPSIACGDASDPRHRRSRRHRWRRRARGGPANTAASSPYTTWEPRSARHR